MENPAELPPFVQSPRGAEAKPGTRPVAPEGRELDHRLANSLQLATDFLLFEEARLTDPVAREALRTTAARLLAVGQLHRFLSANGQAAGVNFASFLAQLSGFITGSTGLRCSVDAEVVTLPGEVAQQLAIVINELAMNAVKHAYRPGEPGEMHIGAHRDDGWLRLSVSDRGGGLGKSLTGEQPTGLGLTIVQAIVRQLKATLEVADDKGAVFTITLPLDPPAPRISRSFAPPEAP